MGSDGISSGSGLPPAALTSRGSSSAPSELRPILVQVESSKTSEVFSGQHNYSLLFQLSMDLKASVAASDAKLASLKESIDKVESRVEKVEGKLSDLQKSVAVSDAKLESLKVSIDEVKGTVVNVKEELSGVTRKINQATAILITLVVPIGGFLISKLWDVVKPHIVLFFR